MDAMLKEVKSRHGRLDAVVANAAIADDHAPLGKITEEQFDRMIGTNLKGVLFAVQSAVPLHVQRRFDHPHRIDRLRGAACGHEHLRRHQGGLPRDGPRPHPGCEGDRRSHQRPESRARSIRRRCGRLSARRPARIESTGSSSRWRSGVQSDGLVRRARSARSRCSSRVTRQATSMAWNSLPMAV